MQQPLQITFHQLEHSDTVESRIRDKVAELERFHGNITSCRVTVEAAHRHQHKGRLYSVRVDIRLPGEEIVVGRDPGRHQAHEDVYVAIRDAFDAAVRQLEDYVRKRRGKVKHHEVPGHGKVSHLFPGEDYGFVQMADGTDVYFHANSIVGTSLSSLRVGDEVRVVVAEGVGEKGPQASTVIPVGKHHPTGETMA